MGRHEPRPDSAPVLCVRCGSPRVVDFAGEVACSACGAVMPAGPPAPEPEPEPDHSYPGTLLL
jgi:hypothetical protein